MTLSNTLPVLPLAPEECWRRTDPSIFFLPESEFLRADGSPYLTAQGQLNSASFKWNITVQDHTDVKSVLQTLSSTPVVQPLLQAQAESFVGLTSACVVRIDGNHVLVSLTKDLTDVVSVAPISGPVSTALNSQSAIGAALTERLNAAVLSHLGINISAQKSDISAPLVIVQINAHQTYSQSFCNLDITCDANAHANLVIDDAGSAFAHHRHSVSLKQGSKVSSFWASVPSAESHTQLLERQINIAEGAELLDFTLLCSQGDGRVLSHICTQGAKAKAQCGALVLCEKGALDFEPVHHHQAPGGETHLNVKMLGAGGTQAVFQGLIKVEETAPHTISSQINKNLLLSKRSKIDSLPRLEIIPNEVSCKHGSASGEVDSKQLYYLMTRGFSEVQSKAMVVKSFAAEGLSALPEDSVVKALASELVDTLVSGLRVLQKA